VPLATAGRDWFGNGSSAKPETFMNLSGMAVRELVEKNEIRPEADLIVIQDELDFRSARCEFIASAVRRGITGSSR